MVSQTTPAAAPAAPRTEPAPTYQPGIDICDRGTEMVFVADIPGAQPDGIDVRFEDGVLSLEATVARRELPGRIVRQEYGVGNYRRSFRLGDGFDASLISADYRKGVLTIRVPRLAAVRPRKVEVRTA